MNLKGALAVLACFSTLPVSAAVITLRVFNFDYGATPNVGSDPIIEVGDTVHWVWDSNFHSTTSAAGMSEFWDSGVLNLGATFDHTFSSVGSYGYYCDLHGADLGGGNVTGMAGFIYVANTAVANNYAIFRGIPVSGGVAELGSSDNQYLIVQKGFVVTQAEAPIQVNFFHTSPVLAPTRMAVNLEESVNASGLNRRVEILNVQTNQLETLETATAQMTDKTSQYVLTGALSRFVNQTDGKVTVKVSYFPVGPVTLSNWQARFDRVAVLVR